MVSASGEQSMISEWRAQFATRELSLSKMAVRVKREDLTTKW